MYYNNTIMKIICDWNNCNKIGEYKAPIEKDNSKEFRYLCLEHIREFNWATDQEIDFIKKCCLRINDFMQGMFRAVGIKLVDFKLEFGRLSQYEKKRIVLADEISPDTCRLWDASSDKKLDKDRFRKDLGNLLESYQEVARRLNILHEETNIKTVEFGKLRSIKSKK